jgi:eukaryotic-like serine/threonine-protein kinase
LIVAKQYEKIGLDITNSEQATGNLSQQLTVETAIVRPLVEALQPGDFLPGYHVHDVIGTGGCGIVYRATQLGLNRVVALKSVRLDSSTSETTLVRFDREAMILAKLQHQNIVCVHDYGRHDGRVYIAMECLQGEDLDQRIKRTGPLDEPTIWNIARQTAVALAYAASHGIIHRDIKPANLFLATPPSHSSLPSCSPVVKVMDFGLALTKEAPVAVDDHRLTHDGVVIGTPAYMAPEQLNHNDIDHRADLYALGATVHHALVGRPPFEGTTVWDVMLKKSKSVCKLPDSVSHASASLLRALLAAEPKDRISDYEELIRRIDAISWSNGATAADPAQKSRPRQRWKWYVGGVAIAVVVLSLVFTAWWASGPRSVDGPPPVVVASGRREVLSDRARLASWQIAGQVRYETDEDGAQVLTTSGSVTWNFDPSEANRLSLGVDPHLADTVDLLFDENLGLRISRTKGIEIGLFRGNDRFERLSANLPYPTADDRDGLVPYLSIELVRVGERWDIWFDHRHVGGVLTRKPHDGHVTIRSQGRPVRIERVELEYLQAK